MPQFLQDRSEEALSVPQSGQYHRPSGIGSTGDASWWFFAAVSVSGAVNSGAIFTSLRPEPARLLKSQDLISCTNVAFDFMYCPHRWQYRTPDWFSWPQFLQVMSVPAFPMERIMNLLISSYLRPRMILNTATSMITVQMLPLDKQRILSIVLNPPTAFRMAQ